ncbi:MAG: hypothetical protein H0X51_08230 [Parachlamydiaceae bacterium]|nr:hypothetical protein [Parachlamydiaceae bacterium]
MTSVELKYSKNFLDAEEWAPTELRGRLKTYLHEHGIKEYNVNQLDVETVGSDYWLLAKVPFDSFQSKPKTGKKKVKKFAEEHFSDKIWKNVSEKFTETAKLFSPEKDREGEVSKNKTLYRWTIANFRALKDDKNLYVLASLTLLGRSAEAEAKEFLEVEKKMTVEAEKKAALEHAHRIQCIRGLTFDVLQNRMAVNCPLGISFRDTRDPYPPHNEFAELIANRFPLSKEYRGEYCVAIAYNDPNDYLLIDACHLVTDRLTGTSKLHFNKKYTTIYSVEVLVKPVLRYLGTLLGITQRKSDRGRLIESLLYANDIPSENPVYRYVQGASQCNVAEAYNTQKNALNLQPDPAKVWHWYTQAYHSKHYKAAWVFSTAIQATALQRFQYTVDALAFCHARLDQLLKQCQDLIGSGSPMKSVAKKVYDERDNVIKDLYSLILHVGQLYEEEGDLKQAYDHYATFYEYYGKMITSLKGHAELRTYSVYTGTLKQKVDQLALAIKLVSDKTAKSVGSSEVELDVDVGASAAASPKTSVELVAAVQTPKKSLVAAFWSLELDSPSASSAGSAAGAGSASSASSFELD